MSPIVFIDTETTGLTPGAHEAWEVALIVRDEYGTDTEHVVYVEPKHLERADPASLRINRYYERTADMGHAGGEVRALVPTPGGQRPTPRPGPRTSFGPCWTVRERAAEQLARLTAGATLVGLNVQFDERFLGNLIRSGGYAPAWDYHLIDVRAFMLGALHGSGQAPDGEVPRSSELSALAGVKAPDAADGAHTAIVDARWVRDWHDAIVNGGLR